MTRREELQERYEDALFALLMDDIATARGREAEEENERLKNDPDFMIPEDADRRCRQTIRRRFMKQRTRAAGRVTGKVLKTVVLAAGVAALLFTGVFAASETVRVNTINFIIEVFDTNTVFRFEKQDDDAASPVSVGWLPEGYELESCGYDDASAWYRYEKSAHESLYIDYTVTPGISFSVDTEAADVEYVDVQGAQATLVRKESELQLVWSVREGAAFIGLFSFGIEPEELIRVANELRY